MTKENSLKAYEHFKVLLKKGDQKKVWSDNIQHGMDSILERYPEFAEIEEVKEEKISKKSKKGE